MRLYNFFKAKISSIKAYIASLNFDDLFVLISATVLNVGGLATVVVGFFAGVGIYVLGAFVFLHFVIFLKYLSSRNQTRIIEVPQSRDNPQ